MLNVWGKRPLSDDTDTETVVKKQSRSSKPPEPRTGRRPIVRMILRWNETERLCRVLLDWGASVPILDGTWARQNNVPTYQREMHRLIENFTGKIESECGHSFTYPMRLQHRKHFWMDLFEIGPTSSDCDVILPFWWIAKHPPSRPYGSPNEIRFNQCKSCLALNANEFSLEIDSDVLDNPEALIVGSISSIDNENSLSLIPPKFNKWLDIMMTEAA
jgi:hypothetical protein